MLPGDTIIVVKDGSVHIKVNASDTIKCKDEPENPSTPDDKKFDCDVKLGELAIQTTNGPTCLALTERSRVTINEGDEEIEVKEVGNKVKIKFNKRKHPPCVGTDPTGFCGIHNVRRVRVDNPVFSKDCNTDDKCEIWIRKKP
jgi:hypothetical protein